MAVSRPPPAAPAREDRQDHLPEVVFLDSKPKSNLAGSLLVVAGVEGSELVGAAREAVRARDATGLARFMNVAPKLGAHPIVRVGYHGTTLAEGTVLPEAPGGFTVLLPFSGGALDRNGFSASHLSARSGAVSLATFVIVCEPRLSDFERRAVDRLPSEIGRMALDRELDAGAPLERLIEVRAELIRADRLR